MDFQQEVSNLPSARQPVHLNTVRMVLDLCCAEDQSVGMADPIYEYVQNTKKQLAEAAHWQSINSR